MPSIKTDELSERLRDRAVKSATGQILIARIGGSLQEQDLSEPPNCNGFGRIRHFRSDSRPPWPKNPLPTVPAARKLQLPAEVVSNAQVFQNAACNWRCWYCYVPYNLLAANPNFAEWLTADDLIELYQRESYRPLVIDCSGGQPDLVPEWIPWMMQALRRAGLAEHVYLWSDDNLSNDYYWVHLDTAERRLVTSYQNYGRVCCFKGFDATSFAFNTRADPMLFDRQFELFARLLTTGMDLYCYATFTSPAGSSVYGAMSNFVDRLMEVHPNLPLRTVPLRIENYGVVQQRVGDIQRAALTIQEDAIQAWNEHLATRFTVHERQTSMPDVSLWE